MANNFEYKGMNYSVKKEDYKNSIDENYFENMIQNIRTAITSGDYSTLPALFETLKNKLIDGSPSKTAILNLEKKLPLPSNKKKSEPNYNDYGMTIHSKANPIHTRFINGMDKLTIGQLEMGIKSLDTRIHDGSISEKLRNKLTTMKHKYENQKGKTLNLYVNKKKKLYTNPETGKKNYNPLVGINKSTLSVKKIYDMFGQKTIDTETSGLYKFGKFLGGHTAENTIMIVGGAMATTGFLTLKVGEKAIGTHIFEQVLKPMFQTLFANASASALTLGSGVIIAMLAKKGIRKALESTAYERAKTNEAMDNSLANDANLVNDTFAGKKAQLIEEAARDSEVEQYLINVAANGSQTPQARQNAMEVLKQAKVARENANKTYNGLAIESYFTQKDKELLTEYNRLKDLDKLSKTAVTREDINLNAFMDENGNLNDDGKYIRDILTKFDKYNLSDLKKFEIDKAHKLNTSLTNPQQMEAWQKAKEALMKFKEAKLNQASAASNLKNENKAAGKDVVQDSKQKLADKINEILGNEGEHKLSIEQIEQKYGKNLQNALDFHKGGPVKE